MNFDSGWCARNNTKKAWRAGTTASIELLQKAALLEQHEYSEKYQILACVTRFLGCES